MTAPLPCPFCGNSDIKQYTRKMPDDMLIKYITCDNRDCGATTCFRAVHPGKAVEQWNKRTTYAVH